ncbi:DUF5941 domain-containing protein [Spongiactinospora sp. 9N601]|uniref:DUF5941 domain-containing protein n=1 Tax=Spongiactinospora sp. 9N601 TaxID=3375149 RepID=UPI00378BD4A6
MITQPQRTPVTQPDPDEERRRIQTARLLAYRDDGPLLAGLRRVTKAGLPPVPAALASLVAVAAIGAAGMLEPGPMLLVPALVMVLLVGPTATRDHLGRFDWLVPPLIRGGEFLVLLLVGITADVPKWLLFVLVYVVGYHTYDTVYRTRQSIWPPAWVFLAGLGWEVRLLLIGAGAALGVATWVVAVLTLYLGVLFAVESVTSWVRLDKASASRAAESDDLEASPEEVQEQATGDAERG